MGRKDCSRIYENDNLPLLFYLSKLFWKQHFCSFEFPKKLSYYICYTKYSIFIHILMNFGLETSFPNPMVPEANVNAIVFCHLFPFIGFILLFIMISLFTKYYCFLDFTTSLMILLSPVTGLMKAHVYTQFELITQ